jgi:hypothetical protein
MGTHWVFISVSILMMQTMLSGPLGQMTLIPYGAVDPLIKPYDMLQPRSYGVMFMTDTVMPIKTKKNKMHSRLQPYQCNASSVAY